MAFLALSRFRVGVEKGTALVTSLILSVVFAAVAALLLAAWVITVLRGRRARARTSSMERRSVALQLTVAEHAGRLAMIRELQDVAVLSVSRLVARADGVRYLAESDAGTAVRASNNLVDEGRSALADMRRVLTIAREGAPATGDAPEHPSVHELFGVMRRAGLSVVISEAGDRFALKPGAELMIYRLLQVALENSLRHGGLGTEVQVGFTWTADGLQLLIDDDGLRATARRAAAVSARGLRRTDDAVRDLTAYTIDDDLQALSESLVGSGITQMRERAQLFGGVFHAGSVPGLGFSVSAVFPALRFHNGVHGVDLARGFPA